MTTLESAWWSPQTSPDIKYNISSHSGQLSLKKYCRKSALTACSPRFSPSGTWASTTTSSGMWDHIVGGCVIHFWNQCNQRNQESWDFHEKMIFFGLRAGLLPAVSNFAAASGKSRMVTFHKEYYGYGLGIRWTPVLLCVLFLSTFNLEFQQ